MNKERQLLHAWLCITPHIVDPMYEKLYKTTKEILAQPEPLTPRQGLEEFKKGYVQAEQDLKREPLSDEVICEILLKKEWKGFVELIRKIEELHGIGVEG